MTTNDEDDFKKNCSKWLKNLTRTELRELEIPIPPELIKPIKNENVNSSSEMSDETVIAIPVIESYQNITLTIDYLIDQSKLNFGSISMYKARPNAKNSIRYVQLIGNSIDGMGRYLMPCADLSGERLANWDLEYSVSSGEWQDVFDRIHLISSGVLCRQFINEERTIKVFHYKIQDIPCLSNQISFLVGVFDAVKVPNVPFAYAFSPIGKSLKLSNCMDFFGKAFNFYNWFLNSSSGNLKSLQSLSSEVFPFPSYYIIFVKDLPKQFVSSANLTLISSDLLCDSTEIDQTFETRRVLCKALAEQYFKLRIDLKTDNDSWILKGIINYLSSIQLKTFHGNNDFRLKIKKDIERLVTLENSENLYVPPLSNISGYLKEQEGKLNPIDKNNLEEILELKSRIIFILLERKIERTFLQKLLSHIYAETLINRQREGFSCQLFLKLIKRLTGKDLKSFTDQWIFNSGCPMFSLNFFHNRKRSVIEFEIFSLKRFGSFKFSGNLTIRIVEGEMIIHEHVVHVDESTSKFDVPFHSKAKKPRKKKIITQEKFDFESQDEEGGPDDKDSKSKEDDESLNDTLVSPISWIRIDPEMEWIAQFSLAQPDIMWIEALENDRDVVAQWEAVKALPLVSSTSESACFALERFINDWKAFWAVRVEAINSMALIGASLQESPVRLLGARKLVEMFNKKFGHPNPSLLAYPKANSFEILPNYFLQCCIPRGIALAISSALMNNSGPFDCEPLEPFLAFFADVLKYNDNSSNGGISDGEYLATIIKSGTSAFARIQSDESVMLKFRNQLDRFIDQINRYARLELILPSFRNVIMSSVLESTSVLTIETELLCPRGLENFLSPSNYVQVQLDAFRFFSGRFRDSGNSQDALNLLKLASANASNEFRHKSVGDVCTFELIQFLLYSSMDDLVATELKDMLKTRFTLDPLALKTILSALSVLEGSNDSSSNTLNSEENQLAPLPKLKITLNFGPNSAVTPTAPNAISDLTTSTVMTTPSIDDDDDIWLKELTGENGNNRSSTIINGNFNNNDNNLQIQSQQQSEKANLLNVWQAIWSNYDSIPFRYPVDPSVPGYYAVIKKPMDLSTARDKISTLTDFLMNLRLIFQNCFTFNQPDSLIYDQAYRLKTLAVNELKTAFPREKKLIKRVLKTAQEDVDLLQTINESVGPISKEAVNNNTVDEEDDVFITTLTKPSPSVIPKLSIKLTPQNQVDADVSNVSSSDRQKLRNILQKLCKHRHAYFFMEPVDPIALNIPTYFEIIKNPMDFGTITSKLQNYMTIEEFEKDCRLVFSNCKTFNNPETLVYQVATELDKLFEADWIKFKMLSSPKKVGNTESTTEQQTEVPKIKLSLNLSGIKK